MKTKFNNYKQILRSFIVITITLLLLGISIYHIKTADILITLDNSLSSEQEQSIGNRIKEICKTDDIKYVSKDEALEIMKERLGTDLLKEYSKDNNIFPSQYVIKIKLSKTSSITNNLLNANINGITNITSNSKTTKAIIKLLMFKVCGILLLIIIVTGVIKIILSKKGIKMKNIFTENIDRYGIVNLIILVALPIIIALIIVSKQDINTTTSTGIPNSNSSTNSNTSINYENSTAKCRHTGCNRDIAHSGDTVYCTIHSNKCKICGKYIDEDAQVCMECVRKKLEK